MDIDPNAIYALFGPVLLLGMLAFIISKTTKEMYNTPFKLKPISEAERPGEYTYFKKVGRWAEQNGFVWEGAYLYEVGSHISLGVWRHSDAPTFMVAYYLNRPLNIDFTTRFKDNIVFSTSTSATGFLYPPHPGSYMQAYTNKTLPELFDKHIEGEEYLRQHKGAMPETGKVDFERAVAQFMQEQLTHTMGQSNWPVKLAVRYVSTPITKTNKSLEQQGV